MKKRRVMRNNPSTFTGKIEHIAKNGSHFKASHLGQKYENYNYNTEQREYVRREKRKPGVPLGNSVSRKRLASLEGSPYGNMTSEDPFIDM